MNHFRRIKKPHFRTVKGWKKEVEEVSLFFLVTVLLVVGFSASTAHAQSAPKGVPFLGLVIAVLPCPLPSPATPTPLPCNVLYSRPDSPTFSVQMVGFPFQKLDFTMANLKEGSVPVPGGFVGGSALPNGIAVDFYAY